MQTNLVDSDDDPILWELCKTSALMLTEKAKPVEDVIEKHRKDTEAEQDRFKKSGAITRIEPTVTTAAMMDESRNDVPSAGDNRAAARMSIITPATRATTMLTTRAPLAPEKRHRGGWWRRASSYSGETREKSFAPPWVTSGKGGARHNAANASNDSSGVVVGETLATTDVPPKTLEAREDVEHEEENVADNWSLSESIGKIMNDTRQHKVVYRRFGPKPMQSLKVEQTGDMPIPEHDDHVVVKIMVSVGERF
jgi:hypothetical protein